jgi:hypothetical protein
MTVKAYSRCLQRAPVQEARLTKEISAGSDEQPILTIVGVGPMRPEDLLLADYRIVKATQWELETLAKAGYPEFAATGGE